MIDGVIGREHELAAGDRLLDAHADGPGGLVVRGEAGIGKSALWEEISARAGRREYTVLACRPAEAESKLALVGLADLFGKVADHVLPALPRPQRRALEVALLRAEPDEFVADWRAVATGSRSALAVLARAGPVLLAIDDVQWLDRPTTRALEFAVRRLGGLPIAILVTARTPDYANTPLQLSRALTAHRLQELELGPLSLAALYHLLRTRLGTRIARPTLLRIEDASRGNPFYALELARELLRTGAQPSPGQPLPLPPTLSDLAASRIRRLPADTRDVVLVASAASHPTVELVVAACDRGTSDARAALARAEDAGVVTAAGGRVAFTHPLLASAVYTGATSEARRRAHRRLARTARDPEERARHLALATTRRDERVAETLVRAARRLAARGAPDEAAELCELAADLTPLRLGQSRVHRRLEAAEHYATAGSFDRAREILDLLLKETAAGPTRAEILLRRATISRADFVEMTDLCEQALAEADGDRRLRARIRERLAGAWHIRGDHPRSLSHARAGLALAERADDNRLYLILVAMTGLAETWTCTTVTPGLLEQGAELEEGIDEYLPFEQSPRAALGIRCFYGGRMDEGRRYLEAAYASATEVGDEVSRVSALLQLAALEFFAGNWQAAIERADTGLDLEEQLGIERGVLRSYRALMAAALGDVEEARRQAALATSRAQDVGEEHVELLSAGVLGFVELSLGRLAEAAEIYARLLERDCATVRPKTSRYFDDGIESLVGVGDLDRAREYAALYARDAARTPMSVAPAKAARCHALVLAADGDTEAAFAEFDRSLELHSSASQPFERARTLLSLGIALRRVKQRRAAGQALRAALETFEQLPAPLWADIARSELARTGVRRHSTNELTETEQRVAELAAAGLTNREVAARAFLAPKSVEDVLARVYRKLDIHSRAELGATMAARAASKS